jgi:hypothetical protein
MGSGCRKAEATSKECAAFSCESFCYIGNGSQSRAPVLESDGSYSVDLGAPSASNTCAVPLRLRVRGSRFRVLGVGHRGEGLGSD